MNLIFEALFNGIVLFLKNNFLIIDNENICIDNNQNSIELQYLIKICKIIGSNYLLYLQSYSLIDLCDNYFTKNTYYAILVFTFCILNF